MAYEAQPERHVIEPERADPASGCGAISGYECRWVKEDVAPSHDHAGDDAFVFAHRAVGDVARALSSSGRVEWRALHTHLGTTEEAFRERLGPLQDARDAAAHGDESDVALVLARRNRHGLVTLARQIVTAAMRDDDRIPVDESA